MNELNELSIAGRIATPSDSDWDAARAAWNLVADLQPTAVAFAESANDVAGARPRPRGPRPPLRFCRAPIAITYAASDPAPSSGLSAVELWALRPSQKHYAKVATDRTPNATRGFSYKVTAGTGSYHFYTRARDRAGNYEKPPASADATTVYGP